MPHFYIVVRELLDFGFDAITINRRTILDVGTVDSIGNLAYAEYGNEHPGFDCFVFTRPLYEEFKKNLACVGVALVARGLLYNMVAFSRQMLMLTNVNMTFHLGNDRPWRNSEFDEYTEFNKRQCVDTLTKLSQIPGKAEILSQFYRLHGEKFVVGGWPSEN